MKPAKPADATKRLFADSPLHVQQLARQSRAELRLKARKQFLRDAQKNTPYAAS